MTTTSTGVLPVLEAAARTAKDAAAAAGVLVQPLDNARECWRGAELLRDVWRAEQPPVPGNVLRMVAHCGGYVAAAYDEVRGDMLAISLGLLSTDGLHSHITGVLPSGQGRGLGFALKQHQRWWALEHGITTVTWTSDPLVVRNSRFNLHALGADVAAYLVDFYGVMDDGVNKGDESDRFSWRWDLVGDRACAAASGRLPLEATDTLPRALAVDRRGRPVLTGETGQWVLVALPADVEELRRADPEGARAWRHAVRAALHPVLVQGGRVVGLSPAGDLVLETSP